jgi:fatty-acyl-CoA synthase
MDAPLSIVDILRHAAVCHGDGQVVSRLGNGAVHRYSYAACWQRVNRLAHGLRASGLQPGDRVGTLAWNDYRHLELYYAVSGLGAVVHTVNPRLSLEQLAYVIQHAQDRFLFLDAEFLPLVEQLLPSLPAVERLWLLEPVPDEAPGRASRAESYESLLGAEEGPFPWPAFPETTAASLCYTSGTTGKPKGVLYSHRSTLLHARAVAGTEGWRLDRFSSVLAVVPMFHASAWGIPYAAPMMGSKLVLPGRRLDGPSLHELITTEEVDSMCGVPTVWQGLLDYLDDAGQTLPSVHTAIVGGSAAPLSMIEAFDRKHDVFVMHGWGMTEVSPVGTVNYRTPFMNSLAPGERYRYQLKQGKPLFGVKLRIVDDTGATLPRDGRTSGHLQVRGPWVCSGYLDQEATRDNAWFDTGDIATLDEDGCMQIVDRSKDVIKSGGEWISSIEIEDAALALAAVSEACAVGINHPKWGERPLLLVTCSAPATKEQLLQELRARLAKIALPDDILVVEELPHTATGKLHKAALRSRYADHYQG